jgi:hypothetical protein
MSLIRYTEEQKTLELCVDSFIKDHTEMRFIPEKFKTQEFFNMIVKKTEGLQFWLVPEKFRNKELSMLAVELCSSNIRAVPPKYYCDELYLLLISNKIDRLRNISKNIYKEDSDGNPPDIYLRDELCAIGLKFNAGSDEEEDKTQYERGLMLLYHACCKHNGMALYYVNPSYLSQELCITACCNSGMALQFVPLPLRTRALCQIAIKNAPEAKRFIPEDILGGMFPIALANAPIAPMKTSQHKSKQKKKIIIIKRPIVMKYAPKNKYKKIINTTHTTVPYYSAHEYKKINMVFDKDIVKVNGWNGEMIPLDYSQLSLSMRSTIPMAKLYIEIDRILKFMESINTYPIIYITFIMKAAIPDNIASMHVFMIDNCCNTYNTMFSGTPLNTRFSIVTVNGTLPDPSNELYNVPLCNNLIDSIQSFYNCITAHVFHPQTFPIIYDYDIYTGLNGPMRKAVIKLNSDLIRANKTKRKLTECRTECALLRLELLEAKKKDKS